MGQVFARASMSLDGYIATIARQRIEVCQLDSVAVDLVPVVTSKGGPDFGELSSGGRG